jgi:hypothetical protein
VNTLTPTPVHTDLSPYLNSHLNRFEGLFKGDTPVEGILKGKEEITVTGRTTDEEKALAMNLPQIQAANGGRSGGEEGRMGGREEQELFVVWDPLAQAPAQKCSL